VTSNWSATFGSLKPSTKYGYDTIIAKYLSPPTTKSDSLPQPTDLTTADLQRWVNDLPTLHRNKRPLSPARVHRIYAALRAALNHAVDANLLDSHPANGRVRLPRIRTPEPTIITPGEVHRLAAAMPDPTAKAMVLTAAFAGLRAGEVVGLQWDDLTPPTATKPATIHIRRARTEVNGHVEVGPPKNGKPRRVILPSFLAAAIDSIRTPTTRPGDPIFASGLGLPLRYGSFYSRTFKPAARKLLSDRPRLRYHDLRHTCAALAIAAGANPVEVKELMGHGDVGFTLQRYGGLFDGAMEDLARRMEGYAPNDRT
jgi:integrase